MKILIFFAISIFLIIGYYFQAWVLIDFRKKIGNFKFICGVIFYIFIIALIAYLIAK